MYRNQFFYDGIPLGSSISGQEDIYKALSEGHEKANQIARALKAKIKGVTPGDIEIHCRTYDPQYWLFPNLAPRPDQMSVIPGGKTLRTMGS